MLGMLIELSLILLFLPELLDLRHKLKVSVANLNFFESRSFPKRYLSSSKHFLKESSLGFWGSWSKKLSWWYDCSRGFESGTIMMSSSSSNTYSARRFGISFETISCYPSRMFWFYALLFEKFSYTRILGLSSNLGSYLSWNLGSYLDILELPRDSSKLTLLDCRF